MELDQFLDRVCDQRSFVEFVRALIADREDEVAKETIDPTPHLGINSGANGCTISP